MNINARQSSAALVIAASILMASAYGTSAGEKGDKLSPAVGKIELKDGKGELQGVAPDRHGCAGLQPACQLRPARSRKAS